MRAKTLARHAYGAQTALEKPPRALEYEAIAKITHELKVADSRVNMNFGKLSEALHKNNQLWILFASCVADNQNQLPAQLRAQIFYLSEFSRRHAAQVLAGAASVAPLIEINTAILRGLKKEGTENDWARN